MLIKIKKWKLVILATLGVVLCAYLWHLDSLAELPVCPIAGCKDVLSSEYKYFLGLPVASWGFFYYLTLFSLFILRNFSKRRFLDMALFCLICAGIVFTIYLRYVELFLIKSICIWCWGSVLIITLISILFFLENKETFKKFIKYKIKCSEVC
jgi:uncharacterized membrane protein|uniref:Vitamin K epoxide reductase family protein n=1 Tax=candidate division CPR3 bacterium TaxID=2268181 RepID=A0A7C5UR79_UNCC3